MEEKIPRNMACRPRPHDHPEHPDHLPRRKALSGLKKALVICLCLIFVEFLGAYLSGSLALLADAIHLTTDAIALGAALFAAFLASRLRSDKRSYGYYRLEILAAFSNSVLLLFVAIFIVREAIDRWGMEYTVDARVMLGIGVLGFCANLLMLKVMHVGKLRNLNIRAAFLHVVGDTLSSVAVIIGAASILMLGQSWPDLLASLFVAIIIFFMAVKLLWESTNVLLEGTPAHLDPSEIQEALKADFTEIVDLHDFHVWEITSHLFAMTAHIEAKIESLEDNRLLVDKLNGWIRDRYGIGHTTFQIEPVSRRDSTESSRNQ